MSDMKKKKKRFRWLKKLLILLVILGLAAGAFCLFVLPSLTASATTTYNSYTAVTGSISNSLSFSGSIAVKNNETLTAGSAAIVRQVYVTEEQEVTEGEKLMRLSNGETLKASFDGRVNEIFVEVGDSVNSGASLIQIVDFNNMKVSLRVDEYGISDVYVGQKCKVTVKALDLTFDSQLTHINRISSSSGSTAYYTVTAELAVTGDVLPGMQATVTIPQEEAVDAVILNKEALSFDQRNSAYVLMKNDAGEMDKVAVETGVDNDNYVEITSGLAAGDTVYAKVETTTSASSGLGGLFSMLGGGSAPSMPSDAGSGGWGGGNGSRGFDPSNFSGGDFGGGMPGGR